MADRDTSAPGTIRGDRPWKTDEESPKLFQRATGLLSRPLLCRLDGCPEEAVAAIGVPATPGWGSVLPG